MFKEIKPQPTQLNFDWSINKLWLQLFSFFLIPYFAHKGDLKGHHTPWAEILL